MTVTSNSKKVTFKLRNPENHANFKKSYPNALKSLSLSEPPSAFDTFWPSWQLLINILCRFSLKRQSFIFRRCIAHIKRVSVRHENKERHKIVRKFDNALLSHSQNFPLLIFLFLKHNFSLQDMCTRHVCTQIKLRMFTIFSRWDGMVLP